MTIPDQVLPLVLRITPQFEGNAGSTDLPDIPITERRIHSLIPTGSSDFAAAWSARFCPRDRPSSTSLRIQSRSRFHMRTMWDTGSWSEGTRVRRSSRPLQILDAGSRVHPLSDEHHASQSPISGMAGRPAGISSGTGRRAATRELREWDAATSRALAFTRSNSQRIPAGR